MHFAFFQSNPGVGPVTNNNFRFADELGKLGHTIDLVGTEVQRSTWEHAPKSIRVVSLGSATSIGAIRPLVAYLKKERPDYLLPSGPPLHIVSAVAKVMSGIPIKIYTRTHIETTEYLMERSFLNRQALRLLLRLSRNVVDGHLAASRGAADNLAKVIGLPSDRVSVLYNPPIDDALLALSHDEIVHPWIKDSKEPVLVCVARLVEQKGLDTLVEAVKLIRETREVRLIILGEGNLRNALMKQAFDLGIQEFIDFHGQVDNPFAFMRQADLFVLSANYEGFANVVAEALACGCPVVSTDAPSGPREILANGEFGGLVPIKEPRALSFAILAALETTHDRKRLVERGMRFHVSRVTSELLGFVG
jgi:glycosyltransferase involved in cell wall biosynthesis